MARQAGSQVSEINASHLVMVSQPNAVSALILQAYRQVR
jgi:hypothetical protein